MRAGDGRGSQLESVAYMLTPEFAEVRELFEAEPEIGGAYFRPLEPGVRLWRAGVLQPAVGVGDLGAMDHLDQVEAAGRGVVHDLTLVDGCPAGRTTERSGGRLAPVVLGGYDAADDPSPAFVDPTEPRRTPAGR